MKPEREELRQMYEDQRLTTRQIGSQFNVAHITVRRWLSGYEIPVRPAGRGLANRGITAPTTEELYDFVHVQHLSYMQIAALYGVDFTAVTHWVTKHEIERPTIWGTRRKGHVPKIPGVAELQHRRTAGESATSIARTCGVSRPVIVKICQDNGIAVDRDGWNGGKRYPCTDGHQAKSVYEQRVDNWLADHGLAHQIEPNYPFDPRLKADFLVADQYIEVWGVTNNDAYQERKRKKIHLCKENDLSLIQINHWQFAKGRKWWRPLLALLQEESPAKLF